jgi:putative ABC transport system ATP-binding protein
LLPGPQILLADEPTGNLDPANKRRILELLRQQAAATRATLVVVTHDHSLLADVDRVIDFEQFLNSTQQEEA